MEILEGHNKFYVNDAQGNQVAEIVFVIFTARIAGRAYDESRARVKEYYVTLMELEELYEKEGEEETL